MTGILIRKEYIHNPLTNDLKDNTSLPTFHSDFRFPYLRGVIRVYLRIRNMKRKMKTYLSKLA